MIQNRPKIILLFYYFRRQATAGPKHYFQVWPVFCLNTTAETKKITIFHFNTYARRLWDRTEMRFGKTDQGKALNESIRVVESNYNEEQSRDATTYVSWSMCTQFHPLPSRFTGKNLVRLIRLLSYVLGHYRMRLSHGPTKGSCGNWIASSILNSRPFLTSGVVTDRTDKGIRNNSWCYLVAPRWGKLECLRHLRGVIAVFSAQIASWLSILNAAICTWTLAQIAGKLKLTVYST